MTTENPKFNHKDSSELENKNGSSRRLGARLFGVGWIGMGTYFFGYQGAAILYRAMQGDFPIEQKIAGIGAGLLLALTGGYVMAEGTSDVITGNHHSLSYPLWKKIKERWISNKSSTTKLDFIEVGHIIRPMNEYLGVSTVDFVRAIATQIRLAGEAQNPREWSRALGSAVGITACLLKCPATATQLGLLRGELESLRGSDPQTYHDFEATWNFTLNLGEIDPSLSERTHRQQEYWLTATHKIQRAEAFRFRQGFVGSFA